MAVASALSLLKLLPFAVLFAAPALAHDYSVGNLTLTHPWARGTPPAPPVAAGYVTIVNRGGEPDRLLSITSPAAESIEVHESTTVDGIARMQRIDDLVVAAGQTLALKPGGLHLMILKPSKQLRQGEKFAGTFTFEKAGAIDVEFAVQGIGETPPLHLEHGDSKQ